MYPLEYDEVERRAYMATRMTRGLRIERYLRYWYFSRTAVRVR